MKSLGQLYFIHIIKPSLMITTILTNYNYMKESEFPNNFYLTVYYLAFFMKPIFFLVLYFGLIINLNIRKFKELFITKIIIIAIFFGFPIKEYCDYLDLELFKKFFEGKEYHLNEYVVAHFIVNIIVENLPIVLFAIINNNMLGRWKEIHIDPIIVNVLYVVFSFINILLFFKEKSNLEHKQIYN